MSAPTPPPLRLDGVRLTHGRGWALDCPPLTLSAGERVALVAPSGAGKTTLLRAIAGLHPVQAGEVRVLGQPMGTLSERARRRHRLRRLGVVFQRFGLLPHLSAVENVLLPLRLGAGPLDAAARARAGELLAAVGLSARAGHKPSALSVGEQQRVAVCRALIHRPGLVLADEPTASLDAQTARQVMACLFSHLGDAALLCVTHDPAEQAHFARAVSL